MMLADVERKTARWRGLRVEAKRPDTTRADDNARRLMLSPGTLQ